jgi:hypothetical protein
MAKLTERNIVSGKREDLADLIALIDAKDTPFTSMAPKGSKPGNTLFRWQVDRLPTAQASQAGVVDGTDVDPNGNTIQNFVKDGSEQYRYEVSNHIQEFRKAVRVSPLTLDIAVTAGVKDELANNVAKGITMLKRDMEKTFCSNNLPKADDGSSQGYATRGLDSWIRPVRTTGGVFADDNYLAVADAFRTPAACVAGNATATVESTATVSSLTELVVQDILTAMYQETGQFRAYDALVGPNLKRAFTNLVYTERSSTEASQTTIRTFNRNASDSTYTSSIDIFQGDFGSIRLHPSLFLKNNFCGYVLPIEHTEIRYGGSVAGVKELTDNGGGPARLINAIASVCVKNPLAFGKFDYVG